MRRLVPPLLVLAAVLGVWDLVVHVGNVQNFIFPTVEGVFESLGKNWSAVLASATWLTLREMLLGLLIAIGVAIVIALGLHLSATMRTAIYPLLISSQAMPLVVIAPILAIIFGYGITSKLILVAITCFLPVVISVLDGLASADRNLIDVVHTLDAGRWKTLRYIEAPTALPQFFSGLKIAAVYAPIGAVFGEYAGSQNGLGYVLIQATPQLATELVFAVIFLLTAMAIALFAALTLLERICCPWAGKGRRR